MEEQVEEACLSYCYARKDKPYLDTLEKHLIPLKQPLTISTWWEDLIEGGAHREQEINKHLEAANIILLLVSADFLASSHCREILQRAMALHKEEKIAHIVPILIRPVDLKHDNILDGLQSLPKDGTSISESRNKDKAWIEVRRGIVEVIEKFRSQPRQPADVRDGFIFLGYAPVNGYRWDDDLRPAPGLGQPTDLPEAPWLVSEAIGISQISRRYSIFREKNVLRDFAGLSPDTSAIKQFADKYGELGNSVFLYYPKKVGQPDCILWSGEPLHLWTDEIREMHILVTLWEMIQHKQVEKLKEHIIWSLDTMSVIFTWKFPDGKQRVAVIASEKIRPVLFYQLEWGEVCKPALYYLSQEIEEKLGGHVNPSLSLAERKLYMKPDSLLSALYVLLLLEMKTHDMKLH